MCPRHPTSVTSPSLLTVLREFFAVKRYKNRSGAKREDVRSAGLLTYGTVLREIFAVIHYKNWGHVSGRGKTEMSKPKRF
jgi:hypothetical protein